MAKKNGKKKAPKLEIVGADPGLEVGGPVKSMKKPRAARRQTDIPGTEAPSHAEVDEAGATYATVLEERMALTKQETEARATLIGRMEEFNVQVYRFDAGDHAYEVKLTEEKKIKLRRIKEDEDLASDVESV